MIVKSVLIPVSLLQLFWAYRNSEYLKVTAKRGAMKVWRCVSEAQRRVAEEFLTEPEAKAMLEQSFEMKSKGNEEFEKGDFSQAITCYTKALELCPLAYAAERSTFLSNRAASYMKLFQWDLAIQDCTKAIELGALNDKPLKRRAIAYSMSSNTLEYALRDYETLARIYPERAFYKERVDDLKKQITEMEQQQPPESYEGIRKTFDDVCVAPTLKVLNAGAQYAGVMCGSVVRKLFL